MTQLEGANVKPRFDGQHGHAAHGRGARSWSYDPNLREKIIAAAATKTSRSAAGAWRTSESYVEV